MHEKDTRIEPLYIGCRNTTNENKNAKSSYFQVFLLHLHI
ncbi:hypothetical protein HMPREF1981_01300 [Bacteroides pyogenes F0041]|uniref:Uncharacterized protein n=1 Tax=Bacteroides pyogenes F0041 TaxID=1321819 RepID=U2DW11_9BACE|nr:hypothetical protein HMPREF1981_01300 [Bacteroides pyogenes F0041]